MKPYYDHDMSENLFVFHKVDEKVANKKKSEKTRGDMNKMKHSEMFVTWFRGAAD